MRLENSEADKKLLWALKTTVFLYSKRELANKMLYLFVALAALWYSLILKLLFLKWCVCIFRAVFLKLLKTTICRIFLKWVAFFLKVVAEVAFCDYKIS